MQAGESRSLLEGSFEKEILTTSIEGRKTPPSNNSIMMLTDKVSCKYMQHITCFGSA